MNYKRLIISLALPLAAGFVGSFFTAPAISTWYAELVKPSFNPPGWIFGPMWTVLYILMGISVYLVWQQVDKNKKAKLALWFFWIHLFFNGIWSILFFGLQNPALAFADILIMVALIIVLIILFVRINKWAAWLLVPYL
ncbi:MAG: TspO/MBR family protein, partial [Candidatus Uhrbacteria bacterium]